MRALGKRNMTSRAEVEILVTRVPRSLRRPMFSDAWHKTGLLLNLETYTS